MKYFNSKTILITGGASGIGRLLALKLSRYNVKIILWDIDDERLKTVATEAAQNKSDVYAYNCDVTDREKVYETAEKVHSEVGKVDILINNAGVTTGKLFLDCTDEELLRTMNVNVISHFWTVKAFLPAMIQRNSGHIVTIASAAGLVGTRRLTDYSSSKFAAFGFDESLRFEIRKMKKNISTTVVCPYFIDTVMFKGVKTRFPFILPILKEEYVVARIVKAIGRKKARLIMPRFVYLVWLTRYLPVTWFDAIVTFFGIDSAMDTFTGRENLTTNTARHSDNSKDNTN